MKIDSLHRIYTGLYGSLYTEREMDRRFESLIKTHKKLFEKNDPMLFSSGGRMEVIGNHTDHNQGEVIGATINLDTIGAVTKRDDMHVTLSSLGFRNVDIDLSDTSMREDERDSSTALVRGIADWMRKRKIEVGGFDANTTTRVLRGSGLSSSAAIEVLIGEIFNHLYADDRLSPLELALAGKYAENNYYGKPSGLLDQVACSTGNMVKIDFKDPLKPKTSKINGSLIEESGYKIVIVDTKGSHADLTGEYASVPQEMRLVASYFGKENLREVKESEFFRLLPEVRKKTDNDRALLRAIHFFNENKRVDRAEKALKEGNIDLFLSTIEESGKSSYELLQNVYPSSSPRTQGLSLALEMAREILKGNGAVRVHGGGFAGTILSFVPEEMKAAFILKMDRLFGKGASQTIEIRRDRVRRIL